MAFAAYILLIAFYWYANDIYVEIDHQTLPENQKRENTYGWFIEALLSVKSESTIYLGEGTHYIQTNYGHDPYMPDELDYLCAIDWNAIQSSTDAEEIYMRRNPLRFIAFDDSQLGGDSGDDRPGGDSGGDSGGGSGGGKPPRGLQTAKADLDQVSYGATFKIKVQSWRCDTKGPTSCITDPDIQAVLSLTNPYIQFEVLDEFELSDLVLTGFESLGKGWVHEDCSWWQEKFYYEYEVYGCERPKVDDDAKCPSTCNEQLDEWENICKDDCGGCMYTENYDSTLRQYVSAAVCCNWFGRTGECDGSCEKLDRCIESLKLEGCAPFIIPDEPPTECPICCTEQMRQNERCEAECNFEACNYGNYYRCFPIHTDYMTDWLNLQTLSLFKIGDRGYIEPEDEYDKINMLNINDGSQKVQDDGLYVSHEDIDCDFYEQTGTYSDRSVLECSQNMELVTNSHKGLLVMKDVTIQYFRQEFQNLISFYPRNVTDTDVKYVCNENTGLILENVKFKDIRTVGPIISAPDLDPWYQSKMVTTGIINDIAFPGSISLKDVSFENINMVVPYEHIGDLYTAMPGILYVAYFGSVEISNVQVSYATFRNAQTDYWNIESNAFYFNYIRKLTIDGITADHLFLFEPFLVIKNMSNGINLNQITEPSGAFFNFPCGVFQYDYYDHCQYKGAEKGKSGSGDGGEVSQTCKDDNDVPCDNIVCDFYEEQWYEGDDTKEMDSTLTGCYKYLSNDEKIPVINPLIQVVVKNLNIKNVHMNSNFYYNTDPVPLMQLSPSLQYANSYSYLIQNIVIEKFWDFHNLGTFLYVHPETTSSFSADRPVIYPVDQTGKQIKPKLVLDNVDADDVLLNSFILLSSAVPVELTNINLKNVRKYIYETDLDEYRSSSPLTSMYPKTTQADFLISFLNLGNVFMQYWIQINRQLSPVYSSLAYPWPWTDPLYVTPTVTIGDSTFKNVPISRHLIWQIQEDIDVYIDDIEIRNCECWQEGSDCSLLELQMKEDDSTYSNLVFSDNSAHLGAHSSIISASNKHGYSSLFALVNISVTGTNGFDFVFYPDDIVNITIENSTFSKNTVQEGVIYQNTFAVAAQEFSLNLNQVTLTENDTQSRHCIQFGTIPFCKIIVTGGTYSSNNGGAMAFQCGMMNTESRIESATFYKNHKRGTGADIQVYHYEGLLTIGPSSSFEGSTAGSADSMDFPGMTCEQCPTENKRHVEKIEENFEKFPRVHIKQCSFKNFESDSSIIESKGLPYVIIIFEENVVGQMQAGIVDLTNAAFIDRKTTYEYNSGNWIYKLRDKADLVIDRSTFKHNSSDDGLINAMLARIFIYQAKFHSNWSRASSGWLFLYKIVNATISDTDFYNNTAVQYGSIAFATQQAYPDVVPITFSNCTFRENSAGSMAGIQLAFADIKIDSNSVFSQNKAGIYPGIYLFYSSAYIEDTTFEHQESPESAFIRGIYSNATISRSTFTGAIGVTSAAIKMSDNSELIIADSSISDIYSVEGAMSVDLGSHLEVDGLEAKSIYAEEYCSVLLCDKSNCTILNSQFRDANYTMILLETLSTITIRDSQFRNSTSPNSSGFIDIYQAQFSFENVDFDQGTGYKGGAMYFTHNFKDSSKNHMLEIKNCNFTNNAASQGGAIYLDWDINLIDSTSFIKNNASDVDQEGYGGAITYNCASQTCEMEVVETIFKENSAQGGGGGIYWSKNPPNTVNWTTEGNSAKFGDNFSSPPATLAYIAPQNTTTADSRKTQETENELNAIFNNMPSGQDTQISITIGILDFYGNIAKTSESYQATIYGNDVNKTTKIKGTTVVQSVEGVFIFENVTVISPPGRNATIKLITDAIEELGVDIKPEINLDFYMRECVVGEILQDDECKVCNTDGKKYSFLKDAVECLDCPDEAVWEGGDKVYPKAGYWRSAWNSSNFHECPLENAWLGGVDTKNSTGVCDEDLGYEGRLCTECVDDYTRIGKYEWSQCPSTTTNILILIGIFVVVIIFISIILKANLLAAQKKKREIIGVYVKIMTNYFQIITLVNSFKLDWPQFVLDYYDTQDKVGAASDRVFSFDWYLQNFEGVVFYKNLVIIALLPIAIILASWTFFAIWGTLRDNFQQSFQVTNGACILVSYFLIHPNLLKTIFVSLSCAEIDDSFYLEIDMSQECWTGEHLMYVTVVSIPALIIWGIGMPAFAILMLSRHYRRQTIFTDSKVLSKYGFLYNGYKYHRYYWEMIILYRKCLVVFILVFFGLISIQVQALWALFVMVIAMVIHIKHMPFRDPNLNMLETQSIISASVTLYCGLYYLSGSLNEPTKIIFFLLILFVNIRFFVTWIKIFSRQFKKKIERDNEKIFKWTFGRWKLVKRYLKYRQVGANGLQNCRFSGSAIMERELFLYHNLVGDFKTSFNMTEKQFQEIVSNKGKMLMNLLHKELNNKDDKFSRTSSVPRDSWPSSPNRESFYSVNMSTHREIYIPIKAPTLHPSDSHTEQDAGEEREFSTSQEDLLDIKV